MNYSAAESPSHRNFRAPVQLMISAVGGKAVPRVVGVIAGRAGLEKATRLRVLPDFFELRLDALVPDLEAVHGAIARLRAPLICTARHPAEGGAHQLSADQRLELLRRFLPRAAAIDLELRSAPEMAPLIAEARREQVAVILSSHHLLDTPSPAALQAELDRALFFAPDLFKVATRVDDAADGEALVTFFQQNQARLPIAAMGLGKLGRASRRQLLRLGSVLNYAAVAAPSAPGQPTLQQLRRTRSAYIT